jgi:hypothetical protein
MTQFEAQLQRIREKLPLAKQKDSKLEVFGAKSHGYELAGLYQKLKSRALKANIIFNFPKITELLSQGLVTGVHAVVMVVLAPTTGFTP